MLNKIGCSFLLCAILFSVNAYAETHILVEGMTVEYDFPPNVPQTLTNSLFWTVKATCKIDTPDVIDELFALGLKKKGTVNGIKLSENQTLALSVHSGDKLKISADSGASVQITNRGKSRLKATCKT
ncbi:hypothetical protein [Legionella israelensis]|uniref:Uncharacterized protein n=1 Tax=Legionella israelensis TaxID=454 RepID=A0A0W0WE30_9GAMM|nr:hypothetical protein [Legionella israelensis]KTD30601.1 hypothetical protein Lisr_0696 [Legionella israelensis]QBS10765.1 hypothetical protein E4T55_13520 [Legionella israelensis]SCY32218.1 hypothetical protein SAMN02746069_02024 [Legionella israelensis DSM 19235]STX57736.1 Uncharacterised protein [Legionella israelensis]